MARVYSWKLPDGRYAYMDPSGKYIRDSRISNTSELQSIGDSVRKMTPAEYQRVFNNVKRAVDSTGYKLRDWSYYFDITGDGGSIFISGRDGAGASGGSTPGGGNISDPYGEMENLKKEVEEMLKNTEISIKKSTEAAVTESVNKLNEDISNAQNELGDIRDRLTKNQEENNNAFNALKDWLASIESGDGSGNSEELNALLREFPYIKEWYEKNKDADLGFAKDAIDEISGKIGTINTTISALSGSVSTFGMSIDAMNSSIGTIESSLSAIDAKIKDVVTYTDLEASAETIVLRQMEAVSGTIKDEILRESALDGETVQVLRQMSQEGWIEDKVARMTEDDTTVLYQKFDAVNASINNSISYASSALSAATRISEDWDAKNNEITKALTTVDTLSGDVTDIREQWSQSSGIVQTVGNFLKKEDGTYETDMMSYMNQTVSGITMGVINEELTGPKIFAAINESDDEAGKTSLAGMVADKILLSGDTFMTNLISEKGIIAGADFNGGTITYTNPSTGEINYQLTSGGSLYAREGRIEGNFTVGNSVTIEENCAVSRLTTKPSVGVSNIEIFGSTINVYGAKGQRNIEFGVDSETGFAVLKFYDNDGSLLYDLGPQGIRLFHSGFTKDNIIYVNQEKERWESFGGLYWLADNLDDLFLKYLDNDSVIYPSSNNDFFPMFSEGVVSQIKDTSGISRGVPKTIYRFRASKKNGQYTSGVIASTVEEAKSNDMLLFADNRSISSNNKLNGIFYNVDCSIAKSSVNSRITLRGIDSIISSKAILGYTENPSFKNNYLSPLPPEYSTYQSYYNQMYNTLYYYQEHLQDNGMDAGITWKSSTDGQKLRHTVMLDRLVRFVDGVPTYLWFFHHSRVDSV